MNGISIWLKRLYLRVLWQEAHMIVVQMEGKEICTGVK